MADLLAVCLTTDENFPMNSLKLVWATLFTIESGS